MCPYIDCARVMKDNTGHCSQTGQTANNADIGLAIAERENKPVNDLEQLPTLGSRSKRTVRPTNRLGFGRIGWTE